MELSYLIVCLNWDVIGAPNLGELVALILRLKASSASALPPTTLQETVVIIIN